MSSDNAIPTRGRLLAEAAGVVALVALQIALSTRLLHSATNFDEDVYLAATDALHHGQALGTQVFAAQFPGFYDLLRILTAVAGLTVARARAELLAIYCLGTLGAWLVGRRFGGPAGGVITAGLLVVAPPLDLFAPQVLADPPSLALSIFAVGMATLPGVAAAVAAGAILCLAVSVKLTAVTAIPPVLWFVRKRAAPAVVGAAVVLAAGLIAHAGELSALWASGVTYHENARSTPPVMPHPWRRIWTQMPIRTPFVWIAGLTGAGALGLSALRRRRLGVWPLWLWAGLSWVFLLLQKPLHDNHLILLPGTLAVAVGATLAAVVPRQPVVYGLIAIVLSAAYVQQWHRVGVARVPQPRAQVAAASALRRLTPPGALTVDDRPIISFLAHRRVVGSLVDLAELRFETGSLTQRKVIADITPAQAVIVSRSLRTKGLVLEFLRTAFVKRYDRGGIAIYVRRPTP